MITTYEGTDEEGRVIARGTVTSTPMPGGLILVQLNDLPVGTIRASAGQWHGTTQGSLGSTLQLRGHATRDEATRSVLTNYTRQLAARIATATGTPNLP
jgi:hypothetical protein